MNECPKDRVDDDPQDYDPDSVGEFCLRAANHRATYKPENRRYDNHADDYLKYNSHEIHDFSLLYPELPVSLKHYGFTKTVLARGGI